MKLHAEPLISEYGSLHANRQNIIGVRIFEHGKFNCVTASKIFIILNLGELFIHLRLIV